MDHLSIDPLARRNKYITST